MIDCPIDNLNCPFCTSCGECHLEEITGDDPELECGAFSELDEESDSYIGLYYED